MKLEYCQFCKERVASRRADGALEALVPIIVYHEWPYHVSCYDKLRQVAARTGGQL